MKQRIFAGAILMLAACITSAAPEYKLTKIWETRPVLETSECVLFNPADKLLYVSCIAGKAADKNGTGFIAKVGLDGKIVDLKWAKGLNAPKGMAIHGGSLYVSDIDVLVEIDLSTGEIAKRYPAKDAVFLNDVAAAPNGDVYTGDSSAENGRVYRLRNGKLETWLTPPQVGSPNGLYMDNGSLVAGDGRSGKLNRVDLETKEITPMAQTDTGIDGLKPDGKGNWLTTNWKGRTAVITKEGKTSVLMDTTSANVNAADFEYLRAEKLMLIPTFFDNKVVAYKLD